MLNYKTEFVVKFEKDYNGKTYNVEDNYLSCRNKSKIWRYDSSTLVFESSRRPKLKKIDKLTGKVIFDHTYLFLEVIDTDAERLIYFKEENFDLVKDLFKVRVRRKMSEEQKVAARKRLQEYRNNIGITADITEEDLEEEINNIEELNDNNDEEMDIEGEIETEEFED